MKYIIYLIMSIIVIYGLELVAKKIYSHLKIERRATLQFVCLVVGFMIIFGDIKDKYLNITHLHKNIACIVGAVISMLLIYVIDVILNIIINRFAK